MTLRHTTVKPAGSDPDATNLAIDRALDRQAGKLGYVSAAEADAGADDEWLEVKTDVTIFMMTPVTWVLPSLGRLSAGDKCPYDFGFDRGLTYGDLIEYAVRDRLPSYSHSNVEDGLFTRRFAWNVKAYPDIHRPKGEHVLRDSLDEAWAKHVERSPWIVGDAFDLARKVATGGGDYFGTRALDEFSFTGRSGGYIVAGISNRISKLRRDHRLIALYVALVCADHDFTSEHATASVEWYINDARHHWERHVTGRAKDKEDQDDEAPCESAG